MHERNTVGWLAGLGLLLVTLVPCGMDTARATDPPPAAPPAVVPAAPPQEPIDWNRARALFERRQRGERLAPDEEAYLARAMAERQRSGPGGRPGESREPKPQTGLKPLTEMTADDQYQGQDGGLYGGGSNEPPAAHRQAALAELARIQPLAVDGTPDLRGRVVFVSISMSNATQEFSTFKPLADAEPRRSPWLTVVDCAQGGQAMAEWAPPDAAPWAEAERRLARAGVTPQQVQVAWVKLANKGPQGTLEEHGRKLQRDTLAVVRNARRRFPNLRIAYLGSRIYGGYATGSLNPEPYAYESAFAARWLIQDQIAGRPELNFDPERGPVEAPLLLWGPYLWADGVRPRETDGLVWLREDFAGDGVHPSPSGRAKVAQLLLGFFRDDPLARGWFCR